MDSVSKNREVLGRVLRNLKQRKTDLENQQGYANRVGQNARTRMLAEQDIRDVTEEIAALEAVLADKKVAASTKLYEAVCWGLETIPGGMERTLEVLRAAKKEAEGNG